VVIAFFGALALALREKNDVCTGFSHQPLEELHGKLVKIKSVKSPRH
jgi:bifunctional non-homologous end joining protein LigD